MRSSRLFTDSHTELTELTLSLAYNILARTTQKHPISGSTTTVAHDPLTREYVYRAVAQQRPWYIRPSRGHYIVTALHATILSVKFSM
jgi:hypothetical protein